MIRGDIEALGTANCAGIAANIDPKFLNQQRLSIRGRASWTVMLTPYSYKTDLTLVILRPNPVMLLRFNFTAAHSLSRPAIQPSPFVCRTCDLGCQSQIMHQAAVTTPCVKHDPRFGANMGTRR